MEGYIFPGDAAKIPVFRPMDFRMDARSHLDCLKPFFAFLIPVLLLLSLSRAALVGWQFDRVAESDGFGFIFLQGVRFDLVSLGMLLAIPGILLPLLATNEWTRRAGFLVVKYYFLLLTGLMVFMELATPNFIMQFDFRPNILFVEYLKYPREVLTMLLKAVPLQLSLALLATGLAVFLMHRLLTPLFDNARRSVVWTAPLLSFLMLLMCFMAARSTLDHRPVNPSTVAFSTDALVNTLPLNSTYSAVYAVYEKYQYEHGSDAPYGEMAETRVIEEVRATAGMPDEAFYDPDLPTLHRQPRSEKYANGRPKNLVIILEESLGADYVGRLGGLDITPELDALADEGIWFEQLYATGTRSVRGIEAVVTGFFPTPRPSVVKLGGSQRNFFTLADLLRRQGYATSFIYGGEAHFDNMRRFFTANGFSTIIDEKDYENPVFYGSWGVSDEDLFNKADEIFSAHHASGDPFFSLVFTSSNHSPFDYPEGRIEHYDQPAATVANAVKYADFALGQYIDKAKRSDYWQDTVFLIIADHSDKVYGSDAVPIERFRIPGLILNADSNPRVIDRITSQVDMIPTLISMIGIEAEKPAMGIDLTRADLDQVPARAIMQFHGTQAYLEGEDVVILQEGREPEHFIYRNKRLVRAENSDPELETRARANSIWPMLAYRNKTYRLPEQTIN